MDFCVLDQDELCMVKENEQDDNLNHFLTFVDFDSFQEYLESAKCDDLFFIENRFIELYPVPDDCSFILEESNSEVKLR